MKIQAYLPCFNEFDVLPHTLRHLHEQGCAVHVIDGWSTDGSYGIAAKDAESYERFPAAGPSPVQCCTDILHRVEELAAASDADWCLYSDADEWRRAPMSIIHDGTRHFYTPAPPTLLQSLRTVDECGYSAIDFRVFQFYCTDDSWVYSSSRISLEAHFQYYDETDCISRIPNRKLWKNVGRVTLAGGGHEVTFPGMRVYPHEFVMKHYPFRTPAQAKAKLETRLARRCNEEHDKGWGVHYDQYPPGFDFCWDPAKLKFWRDTWTPLP